MQIALAGGRCHGNAGDDLDLLRTRTLLRGFRRPRDRTRTARILVAAYNLTTRLSIVEAVLDAKGSGVDVKLVADRKTPCERNSDIEPLAHVGVPIWIAAAPPGSRM